MAQSHNKSLNYILFFSMLSALVVMGAGCSTPPQQTATTNPPVDQTAQTVPTEPTPVAETPTASPTPVVTSPAPTPTPTKSASVYKDGAYAVAGNYMSPGGPEEIKVKLTVQNDVVTDAEVTATAQIGKSAFMQKVFIDNYKPLVIGKKLSTLSLGKVSGSSLTPLGFNDAVAKIQSEAKM